MQLPDCLSVLVLTEVLRLHLEQQLLPKRGLDWVGERQKRDEEGSTGAQGWEKEAKRVREMGGSTKRDKGVLLGRRGLEKGDVYCREDNKEI